MVEKKKGDKPTSVVLTPHGRRLKTQYTSVFGLKQLINAGLYLFAELTPKDQCELVRRVMTDEAEEKQSAAEAVADEAAAASDAEAKKRSSRRSSAKAG